MDIPLIKVKKMKEVGSGEMEEGRYNVFISVFVFMNTKDLYINPDSANNIYLLFSSNPAQCFKRNPQIRSNMGKFKVVKVLWRFFQESFISLCSI